MNNQFEFDESIIVKSILDFTKAPKTQVFSQLAYISGAVAVSKDMTKVRCEIALDLGGEDEVIFIHVQLRCLFNIIKLDEETLNQEAEKFCRPYALRELSDKVAALTKLHTGKPIVIPPDDE